MLRPQALTQAHRDAETNTHKTKRDTHTGGQKIYCLKWQVACCNFHVSAKRKRNSKQHIADFLNTTTPPSTHTHTHPHTTTQTSKGKHSQMGEKGRKPQRTIMESIKADYL